MVWCAGVFVFDGFEGFEAFERFEKAIPQNPTGVAAKKRRSRDTLVVDNGRQKILERRSRDI
jgi:hypothetical protein